MCDEFFVTDVISKSAHAISKILFLKDCVSSYYTWNASKVTPGVLAIQIQI